MKFASIDDAFEFYNQYAREAGFSARISNSKQNKMNEVVWKQFVCFKAGQTDEVRSKNRASSGGPIKKRARGEVRTDSKAKISIVKQQTGPYWSISLFIEANATNGDRAWGPESVGCTERDIRNHERDMRDERKGIDAETLVEFFTSEKEKISSFFFDYETDSDNSDEKTKSYLWLLNKFMEAMPTSSPKAIIIDQDPAITKALAQVLHMLAFFRISQIFELPEKYILKRWTQKAKIGVVYALDDENTNDDPTRLLMTLTLQVIL
ncbi:hypothetical protein SASPL_125023 [Salvia splendens]|uniref:FAR1 domain-containing protein n=1 Tax=Salvia splendens TaxID=180675 RepID=A0A8X8ZPR6_SALSN|nr:hypothetical protein SASPL_125023 [Salvia splendens]